MPAHGLRTNDLHDVYRAEYLHAIEMARADWDPATQWDAFVEALWQALVLAFGFDFDYAEEAMPVW